MISLLSYNKNDKELRFIEACVRNLASRLTDEKWDVISILNDEDFIKLMKKLPILDMACYDVTGNDSIDRLIELRKKYEDTVLMLIADAGVSPMQYIRPSINPTSLLIRPYSDNDIKDKLRELIVYYLSSNGRDDAFIIDGKDGKQRVPYSQILYFEARNKKLYARILNKELSFYGVLDALESDLPDVFVRCHRSFIVNRTYIDKVMISKNSIDLIKNITVPLSRSYKTSFK